MDLLMKDFDSNLHDYILEPLHSMKCSDFIEYFKLEIDKAGAE